MDYIGAFLLMGLGLLISTSEDAASLMLKANWWGSSPSSWRRRWGYRRAGWPPAYSLAGLVSIAGGWLWFAAMIRDDRTVGATARLWILLIGSASLCVLVYLILRYWRRRVTKPGQM